MLHTHCNMMDMRILQNILIKSYFRLGARILFANTILEKNNRNLHLKYFELISDCTETDLTDKLK